MNLELLIAIGLTKSQAASYLALVEEGSMTAPELAKKIGEGRTTAYMALAKLEEIGLATKVEGTKKQTFVPASPTVLNEYIEAKRQEIVGVEERYRAALSDMLVHYYAKQRQTGVQYFLGETGLQDMYKDIVRSGKDVYLLRTYADEDYFGNWLYEFLDARAAAGIKTYGLMPFDLRSYRFARKNNERLNREDVWYPREAYTAPVEVSTYGDKVSIISFGDEASGTILESPQVAQAFRELLAMARVGAQALIEKQNNSQK